MILLIVLSASVIIFYLYLTWNFDHWQKKSVKFLKPIPLFGNILKIVTFKMSPGKFVTNVYEYGKGEDAVGVWVFTKPALVTRNLEFVKMILVKDFNNFSDRSLYYNRIHDPLGSNNLFSIKNPMWKSLRVKLSPYFTSSKIKSMFELVNNIGKDMNQYIKNELNKDPDTIFEVKDLGCRFSIDAVASVAFGVEANCFKESNALFKSLYKKVFSFNLKRSIEMHLMFFAPDIAKLLRIQTFTMECTNILRSVFHQVFEERERSGIHRNDLINILCSLKNQKVDDEGLLKFEGDTLIAQAAVFLTAGSGTTSSTIAYSLYELAKAPLIQEKLFRNIDDVLQQYNGNITYDSIQEMDYLDLCIKEVLRMYPTLQYLDRVCKNQYEFPDTNLVVEAGTIMYLPIYGIHMDPKYHPEPEVFKPERFAPENAHNIIPFTYLPFGQGPRNCIGERLGIVQVKLGLIHILKDFKVLKCDLTEEKLTFNQKAFVTITLNGIHLKFQKRSP